MSEKNAKIETKTEVPEFAEGFSLSGEYVQGLKDKHFKILQAFYEIGADLDNPGQEKKKCVLIIELSQTKEQVKYYPNKTSQKEIINKCGFKLENWKNFDGEFETKEQKVGSQDKIVIYIKNG